MTINELCTVAHENAKEKGFYEGNPSFGALLMQVVEELGEASDADRRHKYTTQRQIRWIVDEREETFAEDFERTIKDSVADELADTFIILAGICKHMDIDIDAHITCKMRYNRTRERLHGKEY